MKGLFIKDAAYMMSSRTWVISVAMMALLAFQGPSFVLCYSAVLAVSMMQSTFNYDEFEGGMSFLMTLPVTRRAYVREKYAFAAVMCLIMTASAAVISFIMQTVTGAPADQGEWPSGLISALLLSSVSLAVSMPCIIRLGVEKGRMISTASMMATFIVMLAIAKVGLLADVDLASFSAVVIAAAAVMLAVSYRISLGLMTRKEY